MRLNLMMRSQFTEKENRDQGLRDGGFRSAGGEMVTIVALGDSTTAGTPGFSSPLEAPPDGAGDTESQYAYWLRRMHADWHVLNHGINGERSDQIRARFRRDVVEVNPDLVVIIAGVNDIFQGRSSETVQQELWNMYDAARAAGILVVAGSIIPFNTATAVQNAHMHAVNAWIRRESTHRAGMAFCDTRAAVAAPGDPDRLAASPDGLHPSAEGYRLMATALEPIVERVLREHRNGVS
jgi:lysophospholipase L1-like esterase